MDLFADYIGLFGVTFSLFAYALLQLGRLNVSDFVYSFLNGFGSVCLLFSLVYHWNLSSVVIEVVWFLLSCYGMGRAIVARRRSARQKA